MNGYRLPELKERNLFTQEMLGALKQMGTGVVHQKQIAPPRRLLVE